MLKLAVVAVLVAVACAAPRPYGRSYAAPSYGRSYAAPSYGYAAPAYSAPSHGYAAPSYDYAVPTPYDFGYDIAGDYGEFKQNRKESGDGKGNVQGSYGYTDAHGIYRQVDYVADAYGFRANVKTNEPGTDNQDPADVKIQANPVQYHAAPAYAAPKYAAPAYSAPKYGGYPRY
ncbi:hypothetical protein JTE90_001924 [Oedothorax gibbosus]|uniref:Cuticle protein n=1 Tax=Oedothorax gibbosus TaxID=931172 RepID=A0AAV6VT28_9ARAC|nr:hypothetical protein JTE90_001924 [Oedothorax gibbosus]